MLPKGVSQELGWKRKGVQGGGDQESQSEVVWETSRGPAWQNHRQLEEHSEGSHGQSEQKVGGVHTGS